MIEVKRFKKLERYTKAVANYRRLIILSFLKREGEASVGEIAEELKISIQATSKHLKILESVEIIFSDQRNLLVYYSLSKSLPNFISNIISSI